MKTLGNKLLAGLLVTTPALADDVKLHSTDIVNPIELNYVKPPAQPFSQQAPLKEWEIEEKAALIAMQRDIGGEAIDYSIIREDRHRLLQLSPDMMGREIAGFSVHGNESVSFKYGYENDRIFSQINDEELLEAATGYYQGLVDKGISSTEYMSNNHFDPLSLLSARNINLVEHFDKTNNVALRNMVTSQRLGIDYSQFYDLDSGLKDYQTRENVTVGSILFKGCVCFDPQSPEEITVIESDLAPTPIRLTELNEILDEAHALAYQPEKISDVIESTGLSADKGASFMVSLGEDRKQDYIYINETTIDQRIFNASRNKALSEKDQQTLAAIAINDIVHHEIQHGRAHQDDMMDALHHHAKDTFSTLFGEPSSPSDKLETMESVTKAGFKVRLYSEVNSSVYGYLKTIQQYLQTSNASDTEKANIIHEAAAQIDRNEAFYNSESMRNSEEVTRLKTIVMENFHTTKADLSSIEESYVSYLRNTLKETDISVVPKFFSIQHFKSKNPYQAAQSIHAMKEVIINNMDAYSALSDEQIQAISHNITHLLVESDTYREITDTPHAVVADTLTFDEVKIIKDDTLHMINATPEKGHDNVHTHQHRHVAAP